MSYRSNVIRLAYTAVDRVELQVPNEKLARTMAGPMTADALKRCIGFLLKYLRCIQSQDVVPKHITCIHQLKFAGCLQSGKSTSFCKIIFVRHLLKSTNNTISCDHFECRSDSAGAQVCREAGERVSTNVMVRDLDVAEPRMDDVAWR